MEKINYPILLVSQLGNVAALMAQYGQYGTIDATTLPNRYPAQFLDIYYLKFPENCAARLKAKP
ncbi:RNA-binding protein [Desulfogranum japonicum]|uniref:hypothetical protein n=1 Tax=Desulfogranum japonicum TaxID=231447 RepID=UPI00042374BC|nr:hypothetical protein [Desulfogranum japonicum]